MSASQPFITPTYQSVLTNALNDVRIQLNQGNMFQAWMCLKTLYYLSPDVVQKECKSEFDNICSRVDVIVRTKSVTTMGTEAMQEATIRRLLSQKTFEFLNKIKNSLMFHGYLERTWAPLQKKDMEELENED